MSADLWSWGLAAWGVVGLWIAGRNPRLGWRMGVASQVLWLAYAIHTGQDGFIVSSVLYGAVHYRNARLAG